LKRGRDEKPECRVTHVYPARSQVGQTEIVRRGGTTPAARRAGQLCAALLAVAVAGAYFIGAGRAYGLDASVTVHRFVATSSLFDPLHKQVAYNNHVLFSFVDHLVYSATGSAKEWVLRIVPIVASALAAGIVAWAVARRRGNLAGISAGAVIAANPILALTGREVRGYSLLLLACVVSTVLLSRLRESAPSRLKVAGYVIALAAGIATHLYGLAMVPIHAAIVGARPGELRRWLPRWGVATALGLLAYVGVAGVMLHAERRRQFQPDFPPLLVKALLGGKPGAQVTALGDPRPLVPIVLLAIPLAAGALTLVFRGWALRAAAMTTAIVLVLWVIAPRDLYPRFFIWLLPAVGYVVAVGVSRRRVLVLAVAAFVVVEAVRLGPNWSKSELANRGAGHIAVRVASAGGTPCAFWQAVPAMEAYDSRVKRVFLAPGPPACDVIVQLTPFDLHGGPLPARWRRAFPYRRVLRAAQPGSVYSRKPG
jgi:hypothetical protein